MFLDFLEAGLAYRKESWVNWDPVDHTVLANEQVIDGRGWRSGALVEKRLLAQWFLRITEFSEELLDALKTLDRWPEQVRLMQENWIGRSEGARVLVPDRRARTSAIEVFTTRPDTLFGASFLALSPHHPLAQQLAGERSGAGRLHRRMRPARHQRGGDRGGREARLPDAARSRPPVRRDPPRAGLCRQFRADGIRHRRDLRLPGARPARPRFRPQIRAAGDPGGAAAGRRPGDFPRSATRPMSRTASLFNSDFLDGLSVAEAKRAVGERLEQLGDGERTIAYRLRDWGVSRQRYWGCPIPVIHCADCGIVPVPEDDLPVELPEDVSFDQPGNPLDHHPTWKHVACPHCGGPADARDRHVRHLLRIVLVFPALLLGARAGRVRPRGGRILDAGRPVYRRRRARRAAPALFALLHPRAEAAAAISISTSRSPACSPRAWSCTRPIRTREGDWLYPKEVDDDADGAADRCRRGGR